MILNLGNSLGSTHSKDNKHNRHNSSRLQVGAKKHHRDVAPTSSTSSREPTPPKKLTKCADL